MNWQQIAADALEDYDDPVSLTDMEITELAGDLYVTARQFLDTLHERRRERIATDYQIHCHAKIDEARGK